MESKRLVYETSFKADPKSWTKGRPTWWPMVGHPGHRHLNGHLVARTANMFAGYAGP